MTEFDILSPEETHRTLVNILDLYEEHIQNDVTIWELIGKVLKEQHDWFMALVKAVIAQSEKPLSGKRQLEKRLDTQAQSIRNLGETLDGFQNHYTTVTLKELQALKSKKVDEWK